MVWLDNLSLFILIFFISYLAKRLFLKEGPIQTPSGAIVMGIGIFLLAAIDYFPNMSVYFGKIFSFILLVVWVMITFSIFQSIQDGSFKQRHIEHLLKSFATGTWVAGTSVLGNVLIKWVPDFLPFVKVLAIFNGFLWVGYIVLCLVHYKIIIKTSLKESIHGIVLLATVSTQSIVILYTNTFGNVIPPIFNQILIYIGIGFYLLGFTFIIKRYSHLGKWKIDDDWQNTNCILHGAMSITGLASVVSGAIHENLVLTVWLWVIIWFIFVELIEIWRLYCRVKKYGFVKAIGEYNVTQWSRNFTFGMLYAFTLSFGISEYSYGNIEFLHGLRNLILEFGAWGVLALLVNEILLFMKANVHLQQYKRGVMRDM